MYFCQKEKPNQIIFDKITKEYFAKGKELPQVYKDVERD
jgi:hypothetical protein